jgi:hypothetical protein
MQKVGGLAGEMLHKKIRTFQGPILRRLPRRKRRTGSTPPALLVWACGRGIEHIEEITPAHMPQWRARWLPRQLPDPNDKGWAAGSFIFVFAWAGWRFNPMLGVGSITIKTHPTGYFPREEFLSFLAKIESHIQQLPLILNRRDRNLHVLDRELAKTRKSPKFS